MGFMDFMDFMGWRSNVDHSSSIYVFDVLSTEPCLSRKATIDISINAGVPSVSVDIQIAIEPRMAIQDITVHIDHRTSFTD
jgi:hypothetical protein